MPSDPFVTATADHSSPSLSPYDNTEGGDLTRHDFFFPETSQSGCANTSTFTATPLQRLTLVLFALKAHRYTAFPNRATIMGDDADKAKRPTSTEEYNLDFLKHTIARHHRLAMKRQKTQPHSEEPEARQRKRCVFYSMSSKEVNEARAYYYDHPEELPDRVMQNDAQVEAPPKEIRVGFDEVLWHGKRRIATTPSEEPISPKSMPATTGAMPADEESPPSSLSPSSSYDECRTLSRWSESPRSTSCQSSGGSRGTECAAGHTGKSVPNGDRLDGSRKGKLGRGRSMTRRSDVRSLSAGHGGKTWIPSL